MSRRRLPRALFAWALLLAVILGVAEGGLRLGAAERLDGWWSDLWHRQAGQRFTPQHVVLAVVDDATLATHPEDPLVFWTPHFARAIHTLRQAGARVVGLDFLFAITPERWFDRLGLGRTPGLANYDLAIRQEIASGDLVLAAGRMPGDQPGEDQLLLPHSDYLLALPHFDFASYLGLADVSEDADGAIRRFALRPELHPGPELAKGPLPVLSLPALLAQRAGAALPNAEPRPWITFAGPPGSFPRISLATLLAPDALSRPEVQALKGKVVLIGGDFQGMNDVHLTPYTTTGGGAERRWMSGVEVQANAAETLLAGRFTEPAGPALRLGLLALVGGLAALVWLNLPPAVGLGVLILAGALLAGLGYGLFGHFLLLPAGHGQLGLAAGFIASLGLRLTGEARQKARLRDMFGRYVSDAVVDKLLAEGTPDLGGETARITVLFSDIRNFTTLSERLSAHEVVAMLNGYFERACTIILEGGGTIDKFIGDAIMVQFGAPAPQADHARRALAVALRLRRAAEEFAREMAERHAGRDLPSFAIGIGIHTGEAVIGNIGSRRRSEFTAIGDSVNTASRLEGKTKEAGCVILASAATVEAAGEGIKLGRDFDLQVKGKAQAVRAWEIIDLEE